MKIRGDVGALVVEEDRPDRQASEQLLSVEEMNRVSGTAGDAFWPLLSLPGLVGYEGTPEPAVRGAFPGDNLYYIDDVPVGYLFHANGAISAIDSKYISEVVSFH